MKDIIINHIVGDIPLSAICSNISYYGGHYGKETVQALINKIKEQATIIDSYYPVTPKSVNSKINSTFVDEGPHPITQRKQPVLEESWKEAFDEFNKWDSQVDYTP